MAAAPRPPSARQAPAREDPTAEIAAATSAYGNWLGRLLEIERPVETQLVGLDADWRAAFAQGGSGPELAARLRPIVARVVAEVDAASRAIDALQAPRFTGMDLDEGMQPAAMVRDIRTLNGRIREALAGFDTLIDAIAREDRAATDAAAARVVAGFGLVLDAKILLARASLAATPRDDPAWAMGNADLIIERVSARMYGAWRPGAPHADPALPHDLAAFADELEANAANGEQRLDAFMAEIRSLTDGPRQRAMPSGTDILRRVTAMMSLARGYFPLSRELAAMFRAEADRNRDQVVTDDSVRSFFEQLNPIRLRMAEIGRQIAAALARSQAGESEHP
ncbi:MAG: hypothetical protein JOZ90_05845 [Alphaproteobacteria bacterium]|nr:hypothetical protein [Alphaproteobacteria bacterium]